MASLRVALCIAIVASLANGDRTVGAPDYDEDFSTESLTSLAAAVKKSCEAAPGHTVEKDTDYQGADLVKGGFSVTSAEVRAERTHLVCKGMHAGRRAVRSVRRRKVVNIGRSEVN